MFRHFPAGPVGRPFLAKWRGWDSNPRSRAHEAREDSHSSTALGLAGRSRTCDLRRPKPAGWPRSPTTRRTTGSTPGGTRTRSFRVEGPASSPLRPRGHESSGGRARTCLSRVTVARLTDSTTPERKAEAAGLEPANGLRRLRGSNALPFQLGHGPASGRRGSRTPKAREPTRFRDGIPRRWQSFREWPRQASNLHVPG